MIERALNIWDYYEMPTYKICVTTNGYVKRSGAAVMGRGVARALCERWSCADLVLGDKILRYGNHVHVLSKWVLSFPVKHNWWELADLALIERSVGELAQYLASLKEEWTVLLPRPGCGNGQRTWVEVKPLVEALPDNVWVVDKS